MNRRWQLLIHDRGLGIRSAAPAREVSMVQQRLIAPVTAAHGQKSAGRLACMPWGSIEH